MLQAVSGSAKVACSGSTKFALDRLGLDTSLFLIGSLSQYKESFDINSRYSKM